MAKKEFTAPGTVTLTFHEIFSRGHGFDPSKSYLGYIAPLDSENYTFSYFNDQGERTETTIHYDDIATAYNDGGANLHQITEQKDKPRRPRRPREAAQAIPLPSSDGAINYRERLLCQIISKIVGAAKITISPDEIFFVGTEEQKLKVQALFNRCVPEMDYIIKEILLAYFNREDLLVDDDMEITITTIK